jgi:hypothetical protein
MADRAKDAKILTPPHQIMVLERQLHGQKAQFTPTDRAFLAALPHRLPTLCSTGPGGWYAPRPNCADTAT